MFYVSNRQIYAGQRKAYENQFSNNDKWYEESVVDKFKSNLLLMIFWLNIINYNS